MNISFTQKQEQYIKDQLHSGDFQNASEVVRDALRLHQIYRSRIIEELRTEISKGWTGATGTRTPSQIAQEKLNKMTF